MHHIIIYRFNQHQYQNYT